MLLSTWIDKNGGTVKVGNILGVKRNCVYAWRECRALPRPRIMKAIVTKSGGKVSYADMVDEYLARHKLKATTGTKRKLTTKPKVFKPKVFKRKGVKLTNGKKKIAVDPGF